MAPIPLPTPRMLTIHFHCRYTVHTPGQTDVKLREEAYFESTPCGEIPFGTKVRIDKVTEIGGAKLRAHICEPQQFQGWTTAKMLRCCMGQCGRCARCDQGKLPSENRAAQAAVLKETEERLGGEARRKIAELEHQSHENVSQRLEVTTTSS